MIESDRIRFMMNDSLEMLMKAKNFKKKIITSVNKSIEFF